MLNELVKVAQHRNFFNLVKLKDNVLYFDLKQSGICMKQNIVNEWFRSIYSKSERSFKVFLNNETDAGFRPFSILSLAESTHQSVPTALIEVSRKSFSEDLNSEFERYFRPNEATELKLSAVVAQSEAMQFFLQWQRYRKIWWSSITTSPGLFHLRDISYKERSAEVEVMAHFPWGPQPVETVYIEEPLSTKNGQEAFVGKVKFVSVLTVECALLTLLADGYSNRSKEEYLRLHRTMAPYKVSFAIDCNDLVKIKSLQEVAELLNYRLNDSGISTWLPNDSSVPIEQQLVERYRLGVPYTAVLTAEVLDTGILHLLNSSTTLKEQIHISDFDEYISKLLKSCFATYS